MAMRGQLIGEGYLRGKGPVRIYKDLDSTDYLFCSTMKREGSYFVPRWRVQFRKVAKAPAAAVKPAVSAATASRDALSTQSFAAPTLF